MSNVNAPFGFRPSGKVPGSGMDFGMSTRFIKGTSTTSVYRGDVLVWDQSNAGYVTVQGTPGTGTVVGIANGFQWQNATQGATPWNLYFPGSGVASGANVSVLVIDDPNAVFQVQSGATAIQESDVGANIQYVNGSGNSNNGISGAYLSSPSNTTNTLPFQVYRLLGSPVTDGASPNNPYAIVEVTFNNQIFKNTTGA